MGIPSDEDAAEPGMPDGVSAGVWGQEKEKHCHLTAAVACWAKGCEQSLARLVAVAVADAAAAAAAMHAAKKWGVLALSPKKEPF